MIPELDPGTDSNQASGVGGGVLGKVGGCANRIFHAGDAAVAAPNRARKPFCIRTRLEISAIGQVRCREIVL
jgi:hypothetical protein